MTATPRYRGRFAPSPTGPLHFGSLVAALASCVAARAGAGEWLVRIEDVDRARAVPGAADQMLRTLEAFGFAWDDDVAYQSRRTALYEDALDALRRSGAAYDCACSRRDVARAGHVGAGGPVYPGTCRSGLPTGATPRAVRVRTADAPIRVADAVYGEQSPCSHRPRARSICSACSSCPPRPTRTFPSCWTISGRSSASATSPIRSTRATRCAPCGPHGASLARRTRSRAPRVRPNSGWPRSRAGTFAACRPSRHPRVSPAASPICRPNAP